MGAVSVAIYVKSILCALAILMIATLIYTISIRGLPFHDLNLILKPWAITTLIDCYIYLVPIGAWIVYKEPTWISALIWVVLLVCFGSITTCTYIVFQLMKLPPQESYEDLIYFVLLQHKTEEAVEEKGMFSVKAASILFGVLACIASGFFIYILVTDASQAVKELSTPWTIEILAHFGVNATIFSFWVAYKESSWISGVLWIVPMFTTSLFASAYIVLQLFALKPHDPAYLVLFNGCNRQGYMSI